MYQISLQLISPVMLTTNRISHWNCFISAIKNTCLALILVVIFHNMIHEKLFTFDVVYIYQVEPLERILDKNLHVPWNVSSYLRRITQIYYGQQWPNSLVNIYCSILVSSFFSESVADDSYFCEIIVCWL
jgi:hypothetical protein